MNAAVRDFLRVYTKLYEAIMSSICAVDVYSLYTYKRDDIIVKVYFSIYIRKIIYQH